MEGNFRVYRVFHLFATTNVEYFVIINEESKNTRDMFRKEELFILARHEIHSCIVVNKRKSLIGENEWNELCMHEYSTDMYM